MSLNTTVDVNIGGDCEYRMAVLEQAKTIQGCSSKTALVYI